MSSELVIILLLVLANGLFAGAEIAVLSVRPGMLEPSSRRSDRRALAVKALRDQPERFLATVQIGITVVGAAAAAFGGATVAAELATVLQRLGLGRSSEQVAFALVIAFVSWLSLVFGELVPKSLALRYSRTYALLIARPLLRLSALMRPLVWFLTFCSNVVLRAFGDRTTFTEARVSREELQQLVEDAAKLGSVHPQTSVIASRALAFEDVAVEELMVPRMDVVALPRGASAAEIRRLLLEEGHSRMPVYDGSPDRIIGYVVARDVLALAWESELIVFDDILRPAYFVDQRARAVDVLRELQRRRTQMAIVTGEEGGLEGLITIEDLLEELVGEIYGEDEADEPAIAWGADDVAIVPGRAQVRRVNRELDLALPVGPDRTTIAGVCMALSHGIPQAGQRVVTEDGTVLEVLEASARRVRRVRIQRPPRAEA
ncbi:MAG TPA: hemolysin family protein [Kofleriaceae bacterium]|nr:hemolysin family protein [Kofleriaceae bacterium]